MLPGKKVTPADVLVMLKRHVWLIVIPPMVTTFAALLYSSRIPNMYQSDMLIAIDPQRVPDQFVRSTVTMPTDLRMDAITIQALSRTALQEMIESLDLYKEERATQAMEDVIRKMRSNIQVPLERPRGPSWGGPPAPTAFHVQFTYPDPEVAAVVAQRIGSRFVEQNARDRGALASATDAFLEKQLEDARVSLEAQEKKLTAFRELHGKSLPTQMQSNMQVLNNAQLQVQAIVESIARDRDRKQMLERLYREASNEPPAPVAAPTSPGQAPAPSTVQQQLEAARTNLAALELRYKADHPDVVRARRLVTDLEPRAAEEAKLAAAARPAGDGPVVMATGGDPARRERLRQMAAEIESLDRQIRFRESEENRVRGEIADYQNRLEAVPGLESEWVKLTRDYDTQQTQYKELLTKSAAAKLARDLEQQDIGERFRIVDPAGVPVKPLTSLRVRYNGAGLAIGLLLGLGIALFIELRDASFRNEGDVMEVLSLPVLANVPRIVTVDEQRQMTRRRRLASAVGAVCLVAAAYVAWTLQLWNSVL